MASRALLGLFFDPVNGADIFLRNFGSISTDCMPPHPRI
jgi:hypothetical protein